MYPVDMVAIYRSGKGAGIGDYWSTDYHAPKTDVSRGGKQNYVLESSSYSGGILSATFTRKLDTGDKYDFILPKDVAFEFCWGWNSSNKTFTKKHKKDGSGTIKMGETAATSEITHSSSYD
jgi:hypothetical protein